MFILFRFQFSACSFAQAKNIWRESFYFFFEKKGLSLQQYSHWPYNKQYFMHVYDPPPDLCGNQDKFKHEYDQQ